MTLQCPNCKKAFELDSTQEMQLLAQVRDAAFDKSVEKAVRERVGQIEAGFESKIALAVEQQKTADLKTQQAAVSAINAELQAARAQLDREALERTLAVERAVRAAEDGFRTELQAVKSELDYYKDLKARMSTKMIGETLEQHCAAEFARVRGLLPDGVYFDKDNDARTGSKGDFIYRETQDGVEVLSIMFEMKNEADSTEKKHKNEDFLRELDRDRREKKCEYAVLVSLLEADSDVYNAGIVDMSHKYPKMYVIRPQFFIPIITILRGAALQALDARRKAQELMDRDLDITRLETDLAEFQKGFNYNCDQAGKRISEVGEEIDKAIARLQKARDAVTAAERQMRLAAGKAEDLTLRRLSRGNQTIQSECARAGIKL